MRNYKKDDVDKEVLERLERCKAEEIEAKSALEEFRRHEGQEREKEKQESE